MRSTFSALSLSRSLIPWHQWSTEQGTASNGCSQPTTAACLDRRIENIKQLAAETALWGIGAANADLNSHHVQPTGMFGDVVELQSAQQASCFLSPECLVERAGGVGGQIIEDNADAPALGSARLRGRACVRLSRAQSGGR